MTQEGSVGKLSRTKGQTGEKELCALLSRRFGYEIKRRLGQERDCGHDIDIAPFRAECKRRGKVGLLYRWFDEMDPGPNRVLMLRGDGEKWLVVMEFEDWCNLAERRVDEWARNAYRVA
jgi:hypothetical protein